VKPGPRKSWAFLYRRGAKMTELGLGRLADVPLVVTRAEAAEMRGVLAANGDPKAHRERKRQAKALEDARAISFETAARRYHERHRASWHSEEYTCAWLRCLELHAFPTIGALGVGSVDLAVVKGVLEPICYDKPRVSHFVRANIESVPNYARAEGHRDADNPARWDLLKHTLPARKGARTAGHFRALSYSDVPALWKALLDQETISARCLQFTILTAARTKESSRCRWSDIDLAARIRGVQILKGGQAWQHMVPLPDQAMALLRRRPTMLESGLALKCWGG